MTPTLLLAGSLLYVALALAVPAIGRRLRRAREERW